MIGEFQGSYRFLSNFWPASVELDGVLYPTVEHAYQAAKTISPEQRLRIAAVPTPGQAKRAGRGVTIRPDWDSVKLEIMQDLLRQKFNKAHLRQQLQATGEEELVEGNTWGDTFWGRCRGVGKNHLGLILMQIREEKRGQ